MIFPSECCPACHGHGYRHLPEAGAKLRRIRKHFGISQTAMARELGVSPQRVNDWEAGRRLTPRDITEVWEPACQKLGRQPELPAHLREACESSAPIPHSPTPAAADDVAPAPSEPPPKIWIPRSLREQGWSVVDGQVMRPSDEGSARRRR
jgi:transcriptional regulator with XRE-family HTH domain